MKYFKALAALLVLALAGCGGDLNVSVQQRWNEGIRNYGLVSIYPMREDVYVGTVRLLLDEERPFGLNSRNYGYIDLRAALTQAYSTLPSYSELSTGVDSVITNDASNTAYAVWSQPDSPAGGAIGGEGANRPRLATLPGVSLVRINAADFQRPGLLSAITGAYRREANLDISLGAIESVELDDVTAYRVFGSAVESRLVRDPVFRDAICVSFTTMEGRDFSRLRLTMVTRVFYARSITYNYGNDLSGGLNVARQAPESAESVVTSPTADGADAVAAEAADATAAVGQSGPTTGSVSGVSNTALQRNEVFERPLAFGVSTLSFLVRELGLACGDDGAEIVLGSELHRLTQEACGTTPISECTLAGASAWQFSGGFAPQPSIASAAVGPGNTATALGGGGALGELGIDDFQSP